MKSINYKSDFKLIESGCDFSVPFLFEYRTALGCCYKASYADGKYENCKLLEDGRLMVVFDSHRLMPGILTCTRHFYLTDKDYHDGICDLWDKRATGIVLTTGKTEDCDSEVVLPPYYQQGEPGKPGEPGKDMTWESMTEEQREALRDSVVNEVKDVLISAEPVDDTEYEDFFNGIKTSNE